MITELMKLLPLITVVGGGAASKDKILPLIQKMTHLTQVVAVQSEVNDLSKLVYLDLVTEPGSIHPEQFSEYCRRNMLTKTGTTRDTSKDFWGVEYRLSIDGKKFRVVSAGPDTTFDTGDDIVSGYSLE